MAWFKKVPNFDFQHLILKHFSQKLLVDFFSKRNFFIIVVPFIYVIFFKICKNWPKFHRLAIITF